MITYQIFKQALVQYQNEINKWRSSSFLAMLQPIISDIDKHTGCQEDVLTDVQLYKLFELLVLNKETNDGKCLLKNLDIVVMHNYPEIKYVGGFAPISRIVDALGKFTEAMPDILNKENVNKIISLCNNNKKMIHCFWSITSDLARANCLGNQYFDLFFDESKNVDEITLGLFLMRMRKLLTEQNVVAYIDYPSPEFVRILENPLSNRLNQQNLDLFFVNPALGNELTKAATLFKGESKSFSITQTLIDRLAKKTKIERRQHDKIDNDDFTPSPSVSWHNLFSDKPHHFQPIAMGSELRRRNVSSS